jgi:hypothetical protein
MRLTVHSTLTDLPFEVELDEPTVAQLQLQVGKHCQLPETNLLKVVRPPPCAPCGASCFTGRQRRSASMLIIACTRSTTATK